MAKDDPQTSGDGQPAGSGDVDPSADANAVPASDSPPQPEETAPSSPRSTEQRAKRQRITFTNDQLSVMSSAFYHDQFPDRDAIDRLALNLGLKYENVNSWFQNRRSKVRRQEKKKREQELSGSHAPPNVMMRATLGGPVIDPSSSLRRPGFLGLDGIGMIGPPPSISRLDKIRLGNSNISPPSSHAHSLPPTQISPATPALPPNVTMSPFGRPVNDGSGGLQRKGLLGPTSGFPAPPGAVDGRGMVGPPPYSRSISNITTTSSSNSPHSASPHSPGLPPSPYLTPAPSSPAGNFPAHGRGMNGPLHRYNSSRSISNSSIGSSNSPYSASSHSPGLPRDDLTRDVPTPQEFRQYVRFLRGEGPPPARNDFGLSENFIRHIRESSRANGNQNGQHMPPRNHVGPLHREAAATNVRRFSPYPTPSTSRGSDNARRSPQINMRGTGADSAVMMSNNRDMNPYNITQTSRPMVTSNRQVMQAPMTMRGTVPGNQQGMLPNRPMMPVPRMPSNNGVQNNQTLVCNNLQRMPVGDSPQIANNDTVDPTSNHGGSPSSDTIPSNQCTVQDEVFAELDLFFKDVPVSAVGNSTQPNDPTPSNSRGTEDARQGPPMTTQGTEPDDQQGMLPNPPTMSESQQIMMSNTGDMLSYDMTQNDRPIMPSPLQMMSVPILPNNGVPNNQNLVCNNLQRMPAGDSTHLEKENSNPCSNHGGSPSSDTIPSTQCTVSVSAEGNTTHPTDTQAQLESFFLSCFGQK